jgi:hypothetical protein
MARAKKQKPLPFKSPPDPQRMRAIRRALAHFTAAAVLMGAIGCGLFYDRQYVDRELAAMKDPPRVVLKNQPVWMTDFLAEQIAKCAQPAGAHSVFDHELLVETRDLLAANPWIRSVRQIRRVYGKAPGDTLEIDCDYRAPVALVHWKDFYWLVDGEGIKLPEAFSQNFLGRIMFGQDDTVNIRIVEGVRQPPPESGAHWQGEDLRAAIDLVKLLYGKPYANEIQRVDCGNYAGRRDPKSAQLVLITNRNTEVRWGRPIAATDDFFVEVPPQKKLQYMEAIYSDLHHIDGNCPWVDLRFDTVTRPSVPSPQTANAQIGQ